MLFRCWSAVLSPVLLLSLQAEEARSILRHKLDTNVEHSPLDIIIPPGRLPWTIPPADVSPVHFCHHRIFPSNPALTLLVLTANSVKTKSQPRSFFCCIFCHCHVRKFFNMYTVSQKKGPQHY